MVDRQQFISDLEIFVEQFEPVKDEDIQVAPELMALMARHAEANILDDAVPLDDTEYQQMLALMPRSPGSVSLFRTICDDVVRLAAAKPLPDKLHQQLMNQILGNAARSADFVVRFRRDSLQYENIHISKVKVTRSYELARGDEDATTLRHSQRLTNCEVNVTIEIDRGHKFIIIIQFTFVSPEYRDRPLEVRLTKRKAESEAVQRFATQAREPEVEFDNLSVGRYLVEILSDTSVIDSFTADMLSAEDD